MKECPQGCLGEVLSRQRSLHCKCMRAGECLCSRESQEAAVAEGKGIAMRSHVPLDPCASRMLEGGWFYLSKLWSYRMIGTEEDLVWLLSRSVSQAAVQSQEVKGEGGIEEPLGNSAGTRVGVLVLAWGVRREDDGEWVDSWSILKMHFTAFPSGVNLSYEKGWRRTTKFEICK